LDDSIRAFKRSIGDLIRRPNRLSQRIDAFLDPRIGKLFHYPPRPLLIPKYYKTAVKKTERLPIAVVTPSYNSSQYLEETVRSVVDQEYSDLQYVIQDGGSDDSTVEILKKYQDTIYHWESRPDNGQSHAINLGFQRTHSDIMAYLNADDLLLPGSLEYISNYFVKHPEVDVVYGHRILIDSDSNEIGRWVMPPHCHYTITWHDFIPQETLFWRRSLWDKTGGRIDDTKQFAMDWELIMRFREAGAKFVRLPRFLGAFRVHDDMKSLKNIDTIGVDEMNQLRKKYRSPELSDQQLEGYIRKYLQKHIVLDKLYKLGLTRY